MCAATGREGRRSRRGRNGWREKISPTGDDDTGETEFEVSKKARGDWVLEERRRWGYRMPKRPERDDRAGLTCSEEGERPHVRCDGAGGETEPERQEWVARGDWVLEERRRWGYRMPKRPERVAVAV
jgi:hypothetical protein